MALPDLVTPPEHIAAERAWREGRQVGPALLYFKQVMQTSPNAFQMERYFQNIIDLHGRLTDLINSGNIDAAPAWKTNLETARNQLATLGSIKRAAFRKYRDLAGQLMATENAAGNDMTLQEAQEATPIQAADVTTIVNAVDAILI